MSVDASKPSQKTLPDVAVARTAAKATVLACILRHVDATREDRPLAETTGGPSYPGFRFTSPCTVAAVPPPPLGHFLANADRLTEKALPLFLGKSFRSFSPMNSDLESLHADRRRMRDVYSASREILYTGEYFVEKLWLLNEPAPFLANVLLDSVLLGCLPDVQLLFDPKGQPCTWYRVLDGLYPCYDFSESQCR